jgi:hypothetical protein
LAKKSEAYSMASTKMTVYPKQQPSKKEFYKTTNVFVKPNLGKSPNLTSESLEFIDKK